MLYISSQFLATTVGAFAAWGQGVEVNMVFSDIITLVKAIINEARLKIR